MPRMALAETVAATCIGRPMRCFDPLPTISTGIFVAVASVSTRANSRSSTGRMLGSALTAASRGLLRRLAAVEREHLGRVQQPLGVERGLDAHLDVEVGWRELHAHEVALLDADPVLAGQTAADGDAQLEDLPARLLRPLGLSLVVGVVEDQRVQVAVA